VIHTSEQSIHVLSTMTTMELQCWPTPKQWKIPTLDMASLHMLMYCKISKVPVTVKPTHRPWLVIKEKVLPSLIVPSKDVFTTQLEMVNHLLNKSYSPDTSLTHQQKKDVIPLKSLIEDKLLPAIFGIFWTDVITFEKITLPYYAESCAYLGGNHPNQMRKDVEATLRSTKNIGKDYKINDELHAEAVECINDFSSMLADKEYLFGDSSSSLDALLFSTLAPLHRVTGLGDSKLQNHLRTCTNLDKYLDRNLFKYFKEELKTIKDMDTPAASDFTTVDWLIPSSIAVLTMVSYAFAIKTLLGKT